MLLVSGWSTSTTQQGSNLKKQHSFVLLLFFQTRAATFVQQGEGEGKGNAKIQNTEAPHRIALPHNFMVSADQTTASIPPHHSRTTMCCGEVARGRWGARALKTSGLFKETNFLPVLVEKSVDANRTRRLSRFDQYGLTHAAFVQ